MKAVILAGGLGTRLSEETHLRPKPMVEVGGKPILWHLMKHYSHHGIHDFIVCLGYKGYLVKEYFANYLLHHSDVTFDLRQGRTQVHHQHSEPWSVTLVDTGELTGTGGRLKRVERYLDGDDFCFTYGDGLSDIDIQAQLSFHRSHGKLATLTSVNPPGRYGAVALDEEDRVTRFQEKPEGEDAWINGGFFVLKPAVLEWIDGESCYWEKGPLPGLAAQGQLCAWRHYGFWQPMDTLRDKTRLEELWASGHAPWKIWND